MAATAGTPAKPDSSAGTETPETITGQPQGKPSGKQPAADKPAEKPATPPADDKKPAADGQTPPVDDKKPAAEKPAAEGAPEKYTLAIPEGAEAWFDDTDLKQIEKLARKGGLTNEEAQDFVDDTADSLAEQSAAFRAITAADPDYGGDHLTETTRLARLALDAVRPAGTPHGDALRRILAKTGFGNNLEVVSFLADLGKLMAEDRPGGSGGGGGGGKRDPAAVLYDNTPTT
jgi:hypothetical protein